MKYFNLLKTWCDGLISRQITDAFDKELNGGFLCPACKITHGRGDNAVYPFYYMYSQTGEEKYRKAAELCFSFQENWLCDDGGVYNDNGGWQPITVFSCIGYVKALKYFGEYIKEKAAFEQRTLGMANWVYNNLVKEFWSNINYQCATALCMALAGEYFENPRFTQRAREMLYYCMEHFTENSVLYGETHPHNLITEKGCRAIDIGYNAEESIPALAEAAVVLGEKQAEDFFAKVLSEQMDFMLPDGAWDNSFTCRNYKWTYYGSRTSDGACGVYMLYKKYNPAFEETARRNLDLMEKCTFDGLLAGGAQYSLAGERPCVHHSFTHAVALTDALLLGIEEGKGEIPSDDFSYNVRYYKELDSYRLRTGSFIADFACYDVGRNDFKGGRGYATGGAMTLLYHKDKVLITASSLFKYTPAEVFNQQLTLKKERFANLTPRAEVCVDGKVYASCLDTNAEVKVDGNTVSVRTGLVSLDNKKLNCAEFVYTFNGDTLNVRVKGENLKYILPVIGKAEVKSQNPCTEREIFNLIPGFFAREYVFEGENGEIEVSISV